MTSRRIFVALLGLLAALDVLILAIRVVDVLTYGRLVLWTAEGPVLYAIWKTRYGYPLYEWPTRPYFTLTLYNFLFYETYAALFALLRVGNDGMAIAGRFVTVVFACAGAVVQYIAGRRFAPRSFHIPLALLSVVTWFGCLLPGWWMLSIRPDMAATALAACGLAAASTAFESRVRLRWLVAAGFAFLLAWSFKQSQIALFGATCAYIVIWRRSLTELVVVAAPLALGAAAVMTAGGAVYRANVLDAPSISPLIPYLTLYWYRSVVLTDLLLWGMSLAAIVALTRPGSVHGPLRSIADVPSRSRQAFGVDLTFPALAVLVAFAVDSVLLAKVGSALNHALELKVAGSLACAAVLASMWDTPKARAACAAGALMLLPMVAFGAATLLHDEGRLTTALVLKSARAPLHLTTPEKASARRDIERLVASLPKPLYTDDELFAQPWHATGGRYPTVMLDHVYYDTAYPRGLVGSGVEGLFRERYFAAALLPRSSAFLLTAVRAGYTAKGTFPVPGDEALWILVRDR